MTEPAAKPRPVKAIKPPVPSAPAATAAAELPLSARQLRAHRSRKIGIRFAIFVGLPTIVACVYYLAIAAPEYDAQAVVAIQSTSPTADRPDLEDKQTTHQRAAHLLADHVRSATMREAIGAGVIAVAATVDAASTAVTVRVRADSPAKAQALAERLVTQATEWTAAQSAQARQERIAPAERDVAGAQARLAQAADRALAQLELDVAVEALKHARLDASHAQTYLVVLDPARAHADQAWPRPAWNILTVIVCAAVLVAVLSLLGAAVREHANF